MISLYMLIAAFVIFVIAFLVTCISRKNYNALVISGAFLFATFITVVTAASVANDRISAMHETYDNLMLYYETVETSTNEYVRFDYYEKVAEYNSAYDFNLTQEEGPLFGWLYPADWDDNLGHIDFQLHGDE